MIIKSRPIAQDRGQLSLAEMRSAGSIDCSGSLSCKEALVVLWLSSLKRLRTADDGKFAMWKEKERQLSSAKSSSMTESHEDITAILAAILTHTSVAVSVLRISRCWKEPSIFACLSTFVRKINSAAWWSSPRACPSKIRTKSTMVWKEKIDLSPSVGEHTR